MAANTIHHSAAQIRSGKMGTPAKAYLLAIVTVAATALLLVFLRFLLQAEYTTLFFFVFPMLIAGWYGGFWPAMLAVVLSMAASVFFFFQPFYNFEIAESKDYIRTGAMLVTGLVIAGLSEVRKRTEARYQASLAAVARSEARTQTILRSIAQGFLAVDRDWKVTEINPMAEVHFSTTRPGILGRSLWKMVPAGPGSIFERKFREALELGRPVGFEARSVVSDKWLEVHAHPGEEGLSVYFRDITHRIRQAEERERLLEEHAHHRRLLKAMMENLPVGLIIAEGPENRIVMISEFGCQILEAACENIVGTSLDEFTRLFEPRRAGDQAAARLSELPARRAANGETVIDEEWLIRTPGGKTRWLVATAASLTDEAGRVTGAVVAWRDITGQKQAQQKIEALYDAAREEIEKRREVEEELKRSNDDLQQFATVISHDLQEPLRTSAGFAGILSKRHREELSTGAAELLDMTVQGLEKMGQMVGSLLEYSRIGRETHPSHEVNLQFALDWAKNTLTRSLRESGASIASDNLPTVQGDFGRFVQLFQNLIANSIRYRSSAPPEIRITVRREADRWKICVRDNGMGIDPLRMAEIFQPFKRLHGAEIPGSGMGLAICKKIVERHGGEIWAEPVETGARFCFTVPALPVT